MSIFISIGTLHDTEIYNTISSALEGADDSDNIYIGIACFANQKFFNDLASATSTNKNIFVDWYDAKENIGIGKGRALSRRRYEGQDNILQVDSHTLFRSGWDTSLKSMWSEALQVTGNDKTVLTAYLPKYKVEDGTRMVDDGQSRYAPLLQNNLSMPQGFLSWGDVPLSQFPTPIYEKFVPSNKSNGNFIFSNEEFVKNSGLTEDALFFDEDIIQSIGLIDNGFSLVFPNAVLPLHHLYFFDQDAHSELRDDPPFSLQKMHESLNAYVSNPANYSKVRVWEEYAHANVMQGKADPWYVPESFINMGEVVNAL